MMSTILSAVVAGVVSMQRFGRPMLAVLALGWLGMSSNAEAVTRTWSGSPDVSRRWNTTNATNFTEGIYADGQDVRFGNTITAPGEGNVFIQDASGVPTDVSPLSMEVRRGTTWNFSGGRILSGSLLIDNTAQVAFTGYTSAQGFSSVTVNQGNLKFNATGAGTYKFANVPINYTGLGDTFTYNATGSGLFEMQDSFVFTNSNTSNLTATGSTGTTNFLFSGNISMNAAGARTLSLNGNNDSHYLELSGNLGIVGTKTLDMPNMTDVRLTGTVSGGVGTTLNLSASNGDIRTYTLPTTGTNMNVGYLKFNTSRTLINPTNPLEDYFQTIRTNGGKIELTNSATSFSHQFAEMRLRNGSFQSTDFVVGTAVGSAYNLRNRLIFDNTNSSFNPTLVGTFEVGGSGSIPAIIWNKDSAATSQVNGNLQVGNNGQLFLQSTSATAATTFTLNGNLSLLGGSAVERPVGRTARVLVSGSNQLLLGDGNSGTAETITLRGNLIVSGGPNEAWGFNANTVVDDGNVTLRYVGPTGPVNAASNPQNKYAISWLNAAGTLQAFRGGSAGTYFAPDAAWQDTSAVNDGMVLQGAGPTVFTTSSAAVLENSGLITFATNLANNGVAHTRGNVLVTGPSGSFNLAAGGRVRAALITAQGGGTLSGTGKFISNVTLNGGIIAPGNSAGLLTIEGNLSLTGSNNVLQMEITGGNAVAGTDYDQLAVTGSVTGLGLSSLVVNINSVSPSLLVGDVFTILTSTTNFTGQQFSTVTISGYNFDITYGNGFITLSNLVAQVPEPSSLLLSGIGLLFVAARRRSNKTRGNK